MFHRDKHRSMGMNEHAEKGGSDTYITKITEIQPPKQTAAEAMKLFVKHPSRQERPF